MSAHTHLPVPDMDRWSADQALAVYDLCQAISATLMQRYEDQLVHKMIESEEHHCASDKSSEHNLSLPFDDVI